MTQALKSLPLWCSRMAAVTGALAFMLARPAHGQTTTADAPRPAETAPASEHAHLRASHRVDVIAPGEKIDTVIDRMRANVAPAPAPSNTNNGQRPPPPGPGPRPDRGEGPPDGPRGPNGGGPPPPPPDRPHR